MSSNQKYKRYFIILENEDRGFQRDTKSLPKGYAKIEARNGKGVLDLHVQDLKYNNNAEYIYRGYLVNTNKEVDNAVDLGSIAIDKKGKGNLKFKFNPSNVDKTNMDIEDFNVVAIVAKSIGRNNDRQLQGPLVGYIDKKKVRWKDLISIPVIDDVNEQENDVELEGKYKKKYDEIVDLIEKTTVDETIDEAVQDTNYQDISREDPDMDIETDMPDPIYLTEDDMVEPEDISVATPATARDDGDNTSKDDGKLGFKTIVGKTVYLTEADMVKPSDDNKNNTTKRQDVKDNKDNPDLSFKTIVGKTVYLTEADMVNPNDKDNNTKRAITRGETVYLTEKDMVENTSRFTGYSQYEDSMLRSSKVDAQYQLFDNSEIVPKEKTEVYLKEYHKTVYKYLKDVLKHHRRMDPFEKNLEGYKWWEIKNDQQSVYRGFLPFFGYILGSTYYNPLMMYRNNCTELLSKYGHYIFGISYDSDMEVKNYVYGVPGRFNNTEQPFQGMTGFVTWQAMEDKEPKKGDYGYWLLHIDPKIGNVVYPLRPTTPPID